MRQENGKYGVFEVGRGGPFISVVNRIETALSEKAWPGNEKLLLAQSIDLLKKNYGQAYDKNEVSTAFSTLSTLFPDEFVLFRTTNLLAAATNTDNERWYKDEEGNMNISVQGEWLQVTPRTIEVLKGFALDKVPYDKIQFTFSSQEDPVFKELEVAVKRNRTNVLEGQYRYD